MRRFADRMPGTSGDAFEEGVFGTTRRGVRSQPTRKRYPFIALKMPPAVVRLPSLLATLRDDTDRWWQAAVASPPETEIDAAPLLTEAAERFRTTMQAHVLATFLCQGLYDQVATLAKAAGKPGLELRLTTGYGSLEESAVLKDMWELSRQRLELDDFVAKHGFHGPNEGEMSNPSWREEPTLLKPVLELYARRRESASPCAIEQRQIAQRRAAQQELLAATTGLVSKARARLMLRLAERHIPLREVGKAAFLRTIDVGRLASRVMGSQLHRRKLLHDPEDVFFLTLDELTSELPADAASLVSERRTTYREYETLQLPQAWVGQSQPILAEATSDSTPTTVRGVPVSAGVVEGQARVVLDPSELNGFDDGDILVCRFTDPSWAPLLNLAGALVIDIGGPMSHGAIVARELGIPAVINHRDRNEFDTHR